MSERIRILRVIARMNAGGPARHVSLLSARLDPERYETLLVTGNVGMGETSLEHLAEHPGVRLEKLDSLGPELRPAADASAMLALARIVRAYRPHIVHTHTAKAGFLGRFAALALRPRPIAVHTYHGHVLEGYFGGARSRLFAGMERAAAMVSDRLIGVSAATVADLVRLRIAPEERFRTVPIGLELDPFLEADDAGRAQRRAEFGVADDELLLGFVGRLVPIKRVDVAIEVLARVRGAGVRARLLVVGTGTERERLEALAARAGVRDAVVFAGHRADLVSITRAIDIALLTSDNEGTPVSLIELGASGRPAVATDVGGVSDVVTPDTGMLVPRTDASAAADAVRLLADDELRARMGRAARQHVASRFAADRLLRDIDKLYQELLGERRRESA